MKSAFYIAFIGFLCFNCNPVENKESGLSTENLQDERPWEATEQWEPVPKVVVPGKIFDPPSDAIILFDGDDLSQWQTPQFTREGGNIIEVESYLSELQEDFKHKPASWEVTAGELVVKPGVGPIETKIPFGNVQLHIEWNVPIDPGKKGQAYSNSGIFFMSLYELQVLNSFENETYPNGQAGSIYKQHIPQVNACRPPGEWQSYDVIFSAPKFDKNGKFVKAAYITVFQNGVLIQNNVSLDGPTVFIGKSSYIVHPSKMPLRLQDHGNRVRYRNIWIRELGE